MAPSKQIGKSELKRLIAARLRQPGTKNKEFIQLTELLIAMKGSSRALVAEPEVPVALPEAEPDIDTLVRQMEKNK